MDIQNIKEIVETIEETIADRGSEMENSSQLTNELIVDDLILGLGYNKKRDHNVLRIFDKPFDWEIAVSGCKLAIKVFSLSTENLALDTEALDYIEANNIEIIVATNGKKLQLMGESEYTINLLGELKQTDYEVLAALSKDTFNKEFLESLGKAKTITEEEMVDIFIQSKEQLASVLESRANELQSGKAGAAEQAEKLISRIENSLISKNVDVASEAFEELRNQVKELTAKNNEDITTIQSLQITIDELNAKIKETSGESRRKALEILSLIDDSNNAKRSYVAVINDEIIQYSQLHTFVGKVLQTLYYIKSFEAQPFIFNGDVFTLESDGASIKHNDLIINNRAYDVVVTNNQEDEVIQKLKTIFSHFDDIVFEVKKTGNLFVEQNTGISDEVAGIERTDENEEEAEEESVESIEETEPGAEEFESHLLVSQLKAIDTLLWSEEEVEISNIRFIGSNTSSFIINDGSNADMTLEQILAKCIDAVISISESEQEQQTVLKLKQKNLELVSDLIKPYSEEYKDCLRINGTRYVITEIPDVKKLISILENMCKTLEINTDSIFVYMDAMTSSEAILNDYGFEIEQVPISNSTLYAENEQPEIGTAILRGDMFNNILISRNSLQIHKDILKRTLAVKTKYVSRLIDYANQEDELKQIVSAMIAEAEKQGKEVLKCNTGYVVGEQYKLLSDNKEEVGEEALEIEVGNEVYYLAHLDDWQIAESLIKMHVALFNNTSIAVKEQIDADAINYYGSEFLTSEPSTSLAIQSFVRYVASCVDSKQR